MGDMVRVNRLSSLRPLGRVVLLLVLGYPYLILAIPLIVGFAVHAISGWVRPEPRGGWETTDFVRSIGITIGLSLFAVIAIIYLAAVVYVGWKGHGAVYRRGSWNAVRRPWLHGVISRSVLTDRINALAPERALVGPVERAEPRCDPPRRFFYQSVSSAAELNLDFDYCVYGPKAALLPPRETMLRFDSKDHCFEAVSPAEMPAPALIGVHPCDLHAIRVLDHAFLRDHREQRYHSRREKALIVGVDCPGPCSQGVFCHEMAADTADGGFDVMLYPLPELDKPPTKRPAPTEKFGVVFGTDAGREWLCDFAGEPEIDDERRFEQYLERKNTAFPPRLRIPATSISSMLEGAYDSLVWEATAQRCYSCGSCNLVCPTCYCFDIRDEIGLPPGRGVRERTWDGCMLRDFALVAGGHNFRSKPAQRLRHRIYRKGAWIHRRTGLSGCVGCARCERACTARIGIVEILNRLAEERGIAEAGREAIPASEAESMATA